MTLTPQEEERIARSRYAILATLRGTGVFVMLAGLVIWYGGLIAGGERFGAIIFFAGVVESLLLPALLARRWRTPRGRTDRR